MKKGVVYTGITYFKWTFLCAVLLGVACTKEVTYEENDTEKYMHVYPFDEDQNCIYIQQTEDGGFLLMGNDDPVNAWDGYFLFTMKINAKGELVWKRRMNTDSTNYPMYVPSSDGGLLFTSCYKPGNITKMDKNGEVVFNTRYKEGVNYQGAFSYPVETSDGYYLTPYTNGGASGSASDNLVAAFYPDGNLMGYKQIPDTEFGEGVKVLYFGIHKAPGLYTYLINGLCFKNWNGNWNTPPKLFVAKIEYDNLGVLIQSKFELLDTSNVFNKNVWIIHRYTKDNHLMLMESYRTYTGVVKGRIFKINDQLQVVWKRDIHVSPDGTSLIGMNECPDGGYLVTGRCLVKGKGSANPYATKIDANGNQIWSHIYPTKGDGEFNCGLQLKDGTYILAGNTVSFGNKSAMGDVFIVKTDAKGNLQ